MGPGAQTPEELETLFEDAFVIGDRAALGQLFEDGAVLGVARDAAEAHGGEQIARLAASLWARGCLYLGDPCRVVQASDLALVLGGRAINVVRRRPDGRWRYAIALLDVDADGRGQ